MSKEKRTEELEMQILQETLRTGQKMLANILPTFGDAAYLVSQGRIIEGMIKELAELESSKELEK